MIDTFGTQTTCERIQPAERIKRLPPYLFGRLNALKLAKRRAGVDIIDLGMGNPSDPTPKIIIDKLCEAAQDQRNQRYSASRGIEGLRREIAKKYLPGLDEFRHFGDHGLEGWVAALKGIPHGRARGHRLHREQGRLQPHVPGDDGPGRYGHCP